MKLPQFKALRGTFGTWFAAFNGPCLWACLAAAGIGGWGAGFATKVFMERRVLAERLTTTTFRADLEASRSAVLEGAAVLVKAANDDVLGRVDAGFKELHGDLALQRDAAAIAALDAKIEELHNDVRYACRRLPLPDTYLDGLQIPAK